MVKRSLLRLALALDDAFDRVWAAFFYTAGVLLALWMFGVAGARSEPIHVFSGLGDVPAYHVQELAARIRARGCAAETHQWTDAPLLVERLRRSRGTDRLVGYSMGGNSVVTLAASLPEKRFRIVTIDPNAAVGPRPRNASVLNIYKPGPLGGGVVSGARNVQLAWRDHLRMPHDPAVIRMTVAAVCP